MKKIRKFIKSPGFFFRDYFNKHYPAVNNEQMIIEAEESLLIKNDFKLLELDSYTQTQSQPIRVVFTWVDNKDPSWHKKIP